MIKFDAPLKNVISAVLTLRSDANDTFTKLEGYCNKLYGLLESPEDILDDDGAVYHITNDAMGRLETLLTSAEQIAVCSDGTVLAGRLKKVGDQIGIYGQGDVLMLPVIHMNEAGAFHLDASDVGFGGLGQRIEDSAYLQSGLVTLAQEALTQGRISGQTVDAVVDVAKDRLTSYGYDTVVTTLRQTADLSLRGFATWFASFWEILAQGSDQGNTITWSGTNYATALAFASIREIASAVIDIVSVILSAINLVVGAVVAMVGRVLSSVLSIASDRTLPQFDIDAEAPCYSQTIKLVIPVTKVVYDSLVSEYGGVVTRALSQGYYVLRTLPGMENITLRFAYYPGQSNLDADDWVDVEATGDHTRLYLLQLEVFFFPTNGTTKVNYTAHGEMPVFDPAYHGCSTGNMTFIRGADYNADGLITNSDTDAEIDSQSRTSVVNGYYRTLLRIIAGLSDFLTSGNGMYLAPVVPEGRSVYDLIDQAGDRLKGLFAVNVNNNPTDPWAFNAAQTQNYSWDKLTALLNEAFMLTTLVYGQDNIISALPLKEGVTGVDGLISGIESYLSNDESMSVNGSIGSAKINPPIYMTPPHMDRSSAIKALVMTASVVAAAAAVSFLGARAIKRRQLRKRAMAEQRMQSAIEAYASNPSSQNVNELYKANRKAIRFGSWNAYSFRSNELATAAANGLSLSDTLNAVTSNATRLGLLPTKSESEQMISSKPDRNEVATPGELTAAVDSIDKKLTTLERNLLLDLDFSQRLTVIEEMITSLDTVSDENAEKVMRLIRGSYPG